MKAEVRLRVSVVGLFVEAGEVLLIHQATPPQPDCWDIPGGGLEPQETLEQGLRREIAEETGLHSSDPEIGEKGICWLPIESLRQEDCSSRAWAALVAGGWVEN